MTSPVECISGPRIESLPANFLKGSTASLTKNPSTLGSWVTPRSTSFIPAMTNAAVWARLRPVALLA